MGAPDVVYVTGMTRSENFPVTPGAHDTEFSNIDIGLNEDTFMVKLDLTAGASGLLYGTYIGGGTTSGGKDIAVDGSGNVYLTGSASGFQGLNYFPTTPNAYITGIHRGSNNEAFVVKLHPGGNGSADLVYSTFLGTREQDESGVALAVDPAGHAYIIGDAGNSTFPTTAGAFDRTCGTDGACNGGYNDVFIAEIDPAGNGASDLAYATFLGGKYQDEGFDIALGSDGDVYVTGRGVSEGFPITPDAYADNVNEYFDAFVTRLRFAGTGPGDLVYSTAVGGSFNDKGIAIALDDEDRVYVAGETNSTDFPTTYRAIYDTFMGALDAFVFRLLAPPPLPDVGTSQKLVAPDRASVGQVVTYTVQIRNTGGLAANAIFTDVLPSSLLLQGSPSSSLGSAPIVNGQTLTWAGTVPTDTTATLTYTAMLTSTTTFTPAIVNKAVISDGFGNTYVRQALLTSSPP